VTTALRDKDSVGLNPEGQRLIERLRGTGWFEQDQDAAKFCLGYAIAQSMPAGTVRNTSTTWAAMNFDEGEILAVLGTLYPDVATPVRLMEYLIHEGLVRVVARVEEGASIVDLLPSDEVNS
jgi:hypothetical protein